MRTLKKQQPGYVFPLKGRKQTPETRARLSAAMLARQKPIEERFFEKIVKAEGHWLWVGACKPTGYGMFCFRGNWNFIAHRASYIMFKGEIPPYPYVIDHACGIKSCVHPDHLRVVLQADNCTTLTRKPTPFRTNREKTHCIHGHPFAGENLARFLVKGRNGRWTPTRGCLTCVPTNRNHPRRFWLPEDLPGAVERAA
jgi:hypothetical protein